MTETLFDVPELWLMYGAAQPRKVAEILTYCEAGARPYRHTSVRVRLADGTETGGPLAHLAYVPRAGLDERLSVPYGRFTSKGLLR